MIGTIEASKRFVYIENQFFISGTESDTIISNRILDALLKRILRAHEQGAPFKVVVVMPLLPAFSELPCCFALHWLFCLFISDPLATKQPNLLPNLSSLVCQYVHHQPATPSTTPSAAFSTTSTGASRAARTRCAVSC